MLYDLTTYKFKTEYFILIDGRVKIETNAPYDMERGDEVIFEYEGEKIVALVQSYYETILYNVITVFLPVDYKDV